MTSATLAGDGAEALSLHRMCFACGSGCNGLGLVFEQLEADGVSAEWFCDEKYQSYPGIVHGGVIATVLDSAMTNCLLVKGIAALTARMQIDYREPLCVGAVAVVRARLSRCRPPVFVLDAEEIQNGTVRAGATAKFMRIDSWSGSGNVQ